MTPKDRSKLKKFLHSLIPVDGSTIGNKRLQSELRQLAPQKGFRSSLITDALYGKLRDQLVSEGKIEKGRGQGGSVRRMESANPDAGKGVGPEATVSDDKIAEEGARLRELMFSLIPKNGLAIGNRSLLQKLQAAAKKKKLRARNLRESLYWDLRDQLLSEGKIEKGKGKGGSVYRSQEVQESPRKAKSATKEKDLYRPFEKYVNEMWVKDMGIRSYALQITASQGKRATGGTWTRPDLALVAVRSYPFIPGKSIDLITFEVKAADGYRIEGVFETAAHSKFSNLSYLAIHTPGQRAATEPYERLVLECGRFGVGLITFVKPEDWESYETVVEAQRRMPDPADVNSFIATQMSESNQKEILELVK